MELPAQASTTLFVSSAEPLSTTITSNGGACVWPSNDSSVRLRYSCRSFVAITTEKSTSALRRQAEQRIRHPIRRPDMVGIERRQCGPGCRNPGPIVVRVERDPRDSTGRDGSVHFAHERATRVHVRLRVKSKTARDRDRRRALERDADERDAIEIGERAVDRNELRRVERSDRNRGLTEYCQLDRFRSGNG